MTPDFGTVNNLFKMASNREVIFMKEFRIVDMNIFEVWVIAVRFHLEGRNYAQSTKILYSEYSLAFEMKPDGDGPNFKDVHINNTELFHVEHFSI